MLAKRQLAYVRYCQNSSADKCCAFCGSLSELANVIKVKQESFSGKCFSSLSSVKNRWIFINSVRRSNLRSGNLTVVRNSFGQLIVDNKKKCQSLQLRFFKSRKIFWQNDRKSSNFYSWYCFFLFLLRTREIFLRYH